MKIFLYMTIINIYTFDKQPLLTAAAVDRSNSRKNEMFFKSSFKKTYFSLDLDKLNFVHSIMDTMSRIYK